MTFHQDHVAPRGVVPAWLVTPAASKDHVRARGTGSNDPRCIALDGDVGVAVSCRIHADRPPPCREYRASYEDGTPHAACDAARAAHGLAPLSPASWR